MYADAMQQILTIITPTFFIIALGYLFGRVSRASPAVLIDVVIYLATPCLVLTSLLAQPIVVGEAVWLWASCLLTIAGTVSARPTGLPARSHQALRALPAHHVRQPHQPAPAHRLSGLRHGGCGHDGALLHPAGLPHLLSGRIPGRGAGGAEAGPTGHGPHAAALHSGAGGGAESGRGDPAHPALRFAQVHGHGQPSRSSSWSWG